MIEITIRKTGTNWSDRGQTVKVKVVQIQDPSGTWWTLDEGGYSAELVGTSRQDGSGIASVRDLLGQDLARLEFK